MQIFIVIDQQEVASDCIVAVFSAHGDIDDAIDKFCEQSQATREDFEDGPLIMREYPVEQE